MVMSTYDPRPSEGAAADAVPYQPHVEDEYDPETPEDAQARGPDKEWRFWEKQIQAALAHEKRFRREGYHVQELYFGKAKDTGHQTGEIPRIGDDTALIHGTIDVLKPLLYSDTPQPVARRRFRGDGKASDTDLMAAEVAQRLAQYLVDTEDFDAAMTAARDNWLLPGRGVVRVFYEAQFEGEEKRDERVTVRAPEWPRVLMAPCDGWQRLPWIAFEAQMTRSEVERRFDPLSDDPERRISQRMGFNRPGLTDQGPDASTDDPKAGLRSDDASTESHDHAPSPFDTTTVWEIWDRQNRQTVWWSPHFTDGLLDREDDPLDLAGFFPTPKPLLANTIGQRLTPRSDVRYYEIRAREADEAARKLKTILQTISLSAAIPGTAKAELEKLLKGDNVIVAIQDWVGMLEKGGVRDMIQWLPLDQIVNAMNALLALREAAKGAMFEASGVSDIMRAQGDPNETATAQQLKGRYASMRLSDRQRQMAIFARDTIRLMVEVAVTFFDTATIARIASLDIPVWEAERQAELARRQAIVEQHAQQVAMLQALAQAGYQVPEPPPPPEFEHMPETSMELVHEALRNDLNRRITVTIETDSTILADEQEDKEARVEFLQAFASLAERLLPLAMSGQMDLKLMKELLMFGVRGFPKSRTLETMIDDLPDEPQGEPQEDTQVQVARIKGEIDRMLKEMDLANEQADREHEIRIKAMELGEKAAEEGFRAGAAAARPQAEGETNQ